MLQEIKNLQSKAVSKLLFKINNQREVTFKAPTGSGKTFMMADLMNKILVKPDVVFIVSTLSKAGLGKQNYEKFIEYLPSFSNLKPYLINSDFAPDEKIYIPEDHNVYVLPRDLYKDKSRIKSSGALFNLLLTLYFSGKQVYLIKDECHIATNNLDELNDRFTKIINISATPSFQPDVEITNEEAVNAKLIKRIAEESLEDSIYTVNPLDDVEKAVDKFLKIKTEYINRLKVNPCLIIQISNKDKADEEWAKIKKIVNDPSKNLKWMYIVDDNAGKGCDTNDVVKKLPVHKWKDYVKNNESLIDIVIFKMVITEGWDIPRACMLYQVRDSQSKQMDEQVVGRVRRNPILLNWEDYDEDSHKIALISWVWGILDGSLRKFKQVSLIDKRNISVRTTKLNSILQKSTFILKDFLRLKNRSNNNISIFDLYRKWSDVSQETQDLCWKNINSFQDWSDFSIYLEEIETENNSYMADYENSMVEDENSSFPNTSYFEITDKTTEISNWSWKLNDPNDDEYHFDSSAEKDFAKILKKINTFFWGKNYYPNSNIKFEYILNNRHKSYPDFILKDKSDKVHIIEVKSINEGQTTFDPEEYLKKIEALKKMFLHASKITKQAFYLPIKSENDWIINKYDNGFHTILNLQMFLESFPK